MMLFKLVTIFNQTKKNNNKKTTMSSFFTFHIKEEFGYYNAKWVCMNMMKNMKVFIGIVLILLICIIGVIQLVLQNNRGVAIDYLILPEKDESEQIKQPILDQIRENNQSLIDNVDNKINEMLLSLKSKVVTFAIFGTDERSDETPRSDIIMLARYYPMIDKLQIVSVPRDTKVFIPGKYEDKINHAYAFGGAELLEQSLEKLFNIEIDYYIKLSFTNFTELIDDLGGVDIDVSKKYEYPGYIDIEEGYQILDGKKALDYVRFRYDEDGDYGRIKRQQEVLIAILVGQKEHTDDEIVSLIDDFYLNISTNIPLRKFIDYYSLIKEVEDFEFDTTILKTSGKKIDGIWYEIIDLKHLEKLKLKLSEGQ